MKLFSDIDWLAGVEEPSKVVGQVSCTQQLHEAMPAAARLCSQTLTGWLSPAWGQRPTLQVYFVRCWHCAQLATALLLKRKRMASMVG